MNIEKNKREFVRLDGKLSWWRSVFAVQCFFWRSIIYDNIKKIGKMKEIENWRKIVLFACVVALAIDPLFLLIPVIDSNRFCFTFDKTVGVIVCVLRTFSDTFYAIHIFVHLKNEGKDLHSDPVNWTAELKKKAVCLFLYLIVDILSIVPIPQVMVLTLIRRSDSLLVSKKILKWSILGQYVPRFLRTYPIFKEVTKPSGTIAESKWLGAAINFFLYMLFSYGFGAFWYVNAIEKQSKCWREDCKKKIGCKLNLLLCKPGIENNSAFLNTSCPLINPNEILKNSTDFNFGMFTDALKSGVLERKNIYDFPRKFIYCFRWGLRHLSALGQNLETSSAAGENVFAIVICVSGLLLFAVLIGNVQKYLQASTTRLDARKENKIDIEKWMSKRELPETLKDGIRKHGDYKWRETRGMEEETLLYSLPKHLTKSIKLHLYRNLIQKLKLMPQFQEMEDRSLEVLCSLLKTAYYTANSYIEHEGKPVEDMLYIVSGELESSSTTTFGFKTGSVADYLYGEELFVWAFDPQSSHYPISSRTIQAKTEVEGFFSQLMISRF